jgi:hypothetical protein
MRRALLLLWGLAVAALAAGPANATSVTVQISGTWDTVVDNAAVTNGSISVSTAFLATLVFDDTTADTNPSANVGDYFFSAAASDLVLATGDYAFALISSSPISFGIDNNVAGQDGFGLFAEHFTTSGPLSAGASTGYGYANPALFDSTATAHSSDELTALPWDATAYNNTSFYFLIEVLGKGSNKFIELSGPITQLSVLPEPSIAPLVALAFATLAWLHRRG